MPNTTSNPAGSSPEPARNPAAPFDSSAPSQPQKLFALPPDMEGWLSTEESAERLGMAAKKFREFASREHLPKRPLGNRVFYAPDVIEDAAKKKRQEVLKAQVTRNAAQEPPRAAVPVSDKFYLEALAAVRQIVTERGRTHR